MTATTPNRGLIYPVPTDRLVDYTDTAKTHAEQVEAELDSVQAGAVQHALAVAAGDLLVAAGADTFARLAKGAAGQVLTVDSATGAVGWSDAAGGGSPVAGTYIGDGTTDRLIPLPFDPAWVIAATEGATGAYFFGTLATGSPYGVRITGSGTSISANSPSTAPQPTTGGFIVSGDASSWLNGTGDTYHYLAFPAE